ncbi:MAG: DUF58 domain-containing protein [Prochlorotrichaceae cyanobacterium]|jgi:uncharacterized protein (DUF58 family)
MIFTLRFYLVFILWGSLAWLSVPFVSLPTAFQGMLLLDLLSLILAAIDYSRVQPQQIQVKRQLDPRLSIGRDNPIQLQVKALVPPPPGRSLCLQIQDFHPPTLAVTGLPLTTQLVSKDTQTLSYHVHPHCRGAFTWPKLQVQQLGAWGLVWRRWSIAQSHTTKVYPDLVGLRELSIRLALESSGSLRYRRPWGIGTEFRELREYDRGDDPRFIDWKATARRGKPLIRVLEPEQEQTLLVLLDGGRLMTAQVQGLKRFDWGLNTALSLALAGLNRGDRVGVGVFDRNLHTWVPPQRGQHHLSRLLETLTPLQPTLQEPDYLGAVTPIVQRQTRRALVVIITDILDPIASSELLSALLHLSPRYLPFCVTLRDPTLDRFATTPTLEIEGAYERSVALDLLAQREVAFAQLRQQGVLVLDAPAPRVSTALVNAYLQLKVRSRL